MIKYICLIFAAIFIVSGCREEIIDPLNPASNVNEPVLSSSVKNYSFSINAQNISNEIINYSHLNTLKNRIYIAISDYTSGSVSVKFLSEQNRVLYEAEFQSDEAGIYGKVEGETPYIIEIKFSSFSGRLKLEISPLF